MLLLSVMVLLSCSCCSLVSSIPTASLGPTPLDTSVVDSSDDGRAGPLELRPPFPLTTTEAPTTTGTSGLLGATGLPGLGLGTQPSASGSPVQSSLIMGAFQAIITPFNPSMLGSVIGALGGGGGGGSGSSGVPSFPSFPIGTPKPT
ncbi:uncharacterized protein LOC126574020 [Anopheles aquasalis]|uniref:uncharacterized protein LOC126574020 n=1 Tax=Anopheles aquasalis TaxID=42839 RepID=UPI00215B5C30|nr:uncharacterized protein LOC126574020 [Anopheles aquasalis]